VQVWHCSDFDGMPTIDARPIPISSGRRKSPQHNAGGERFTQHPQAIRQDVGLTTLSVGYRETMQS
jgi:hypothetical protein